MIFLIGKKINGLSLIINNLNIDLHKRCFLTTKHTNRYEKRESLSWPSRSFATFVVQASAAIEPLTHWRHWISLNSEPRFSAISGFSVSVVPTLCADMVEWHLLVRRKAMLESNPSASSGQALSVDTGDGATGARPS